MKPFVRIGQWHVGPYRRKASEDYTAYFFLQYSGDQPATNNSYALIKKKFTKLNNTYETPIQRHQLDQVQNIINH